MDLNKLVSEILEDAAFRRQPKPYANVYFIKVLNPGDKISMFVSFRYKSSKGEVFVSATEINLEQTEKNVSTSLSFLKVRERVSTTFFRKRLLVKHKSIIEIIRETVVPLIVLKLSKVEESYVKRQ